MLDAERLAALHARAFSGPAQWSTGAFAAALADERCFLIHEGETPDGFALGRTILDEAELLTLVIAQDVRRRGLGRQLLSQFEQTARERGAAFAFLEVSADNVAARALYEAAGWRTVGKRNGYYEGIDAIAMRKDL